MAAKEEAPIDPNDVVRGIQIIDSYQNINQELLTSIQIREDVKSLFESEKKIKILVVGKTGTGKSTLVNGLIGKKVAREGHGLSTKGVTENVTSYKKKIGNVEVSVFDSPGLQDGSNNEDEYLEDIKSKCSDTDLVVFAVKITDSRFVPNNPDARAMAKLTEAFGEDIWKKAIIVLTCADTAEAMNPIMRTLTLKEKIDFFKKLVADFGAVIRSTLIDDIKVARKIVEGIKVVPTGHYTIPRLVDGTLWFSNFWLESLTSIQTVEGHAAMIELNTSRFRTDVNVDSSSQEPLEEQPIIINSKHDTKKMGFTIGTMAVAGFIGAAVGSIGLIGGPVGLVAIPVGLYLGIVIGAFLSA